jgi:hypothetical protein
MTQSGDRPSAEMTENASVGEAGEPQGLSRQGAPQAESAQGEEGTPTPEELDARDEAFSGARKPMGPVDSGTSLETVPEET